MPVDTLVNMARRACVRLSRTIVDFGDCPYELVRPILLKVENPEQLHQLEQNSPQIIGKDSEVWINLIKRDIPEWEQKIMEPRDPKNWYKVYRKLKRETEQNMVAGEQALKAAFDNIKNGKEQNLARLTSRKPLPTIVRRPRASYSYSGVSKSGPNLGFFDKIRKEAWQKKSPMTRPTHELKKMSRGVTAAPQRFVEDIKSGLHTPTPSYKPYPTGSITSRGPGNMPKVAKPTVEPYDMMQDREARLRALKSGKSAASKPIPTAITRQRDHLGKNSLSEDFLEDDDNEDDLFNEPKVKQSPSISPHNLSSRTLEPSMRQSSRPLRRKVDLFMSTPKRPKGPV